jgi:hypothetical protein
VAVNGAGHRLNTAAQQCSHSLLVLSRRGQHLVLQQCSSAGQRTRLYYHSWTVGMLLPTRFPEQQ